MSENEHGTCTRALSRKRENRDTHFMRACAVEMDMRNSKSNFCASRPTQNAATTRANPDLNPALNSYRKNPLVRSTIWGKISKHVKTPSCNRGTPNLTICQKTLAASSASCLKKGTLILHALEIHQENVLQKRRRPNPWDEKLERPKNTKPERLPKDSGKELSSLFSKDRILERTLARVWLKATSI